MAGRPVEAGLSDAHGTGNRRARGRPPGPQNGSDSVLAALGVELRALRSRRGLTLHELGQLTAYSPQHLGAVERAQVVPSEAVVVACDTALPANGRLITMLAAVIREQAAIRHRNQAARRASRPPATRDSAMQRELPDDVDWERLADAGRRPSRVTPAVVEDVEQITDRQRRLYHDLSSAEMLVHVRAHLALLTALLKSEQPARLRHRIASAAGEAAGFAAWLWFDLGDAFSTQRCYDHAKDAVTEAGDVGLGAYITGYRGIVAAQNDGPAAALVHLGEASDTAPRSLSGTVRAWLMILTAEAMAHTGQAAAAVTAVLRAHELLADTGPSGAEPWMYEFDHGSLAAHTGTCHLALGQATQAAEAFEDALRSLPPSCDRRGARIQVGLARARIASGDGDEALRLATAALATFAQRGSAAGLRSVGDLRTTFALAGLPAAASALDEQARCVQHAGR